MRKNKAAFQPSPTELKDTATRAAHAAGRVLMKRFRKKLHVSEKADAGLVTDADFESERAAIAVLRREHPDFGILAEESAPEDAKSPGLWILDPLDGTTNYAHGYPMFCVSVAAQWGGEIVAGVVYHPVLGETYSAVRGKGAYVDGKRLQVSRTSKLGGALLSTGFCSRKEGLSVELEAFERLSLAASGVRRPGSAALDLAHVARGVFDGFWERGLAPWDIAAGALLVEEAGGRVTGFGGEPLRLGSGEILCSNGILHRALLLEAGLQPKPAQEAATAVKESYAH